MTDEVCTYSFAHISKVRIHIKICISKHNYPTFTQIFVTFRILTFSLFRVMLRTVQLYCRFRTRAVKIKDIFTENLLSIDSNGQFFQIGIPQTPFFFCHIFSKCSSDCSQGGIVFLVHVVNTSPTASRYPLPSRGGQDIMPSIKVFHKQTFLCGILSMELTSRRTRRKRICIYNYELANHFAASIA